MDESTGPRYRMGWTDFVRPELMRKWAQATSPVSPNPSNANAEVKQWQQLANDKMLRGAARGASWVIPGAVDMFVGVPSGVINGLGSGLGAIAGGGSFQDFRKEFGKGWNDSRSFVRDNMSGPLRKAEMQLGGNAIKNVLDSSISKIQGDLERKAGSTYNEDGSVRPEWKNYAKGVNMTNAAETLSEAGADIGLSLLTLGGGVSGFGKAVSGAGKLRKAIDATGRFLAHPAADVASAGLFGLGAAAGGYAEDTSALDEYLYGPGIDSQ